MIFLFLGHYESFITFQYNPAGDPPKACVQPNGTVRPGMEDRPERCSSRSSALVETRTIASSSDGDAAQKSEMPFDLRPVWVRTPMCGKERNDAKGDVHLTDTGKVEGKDVISELL